VTTVNHLKPGTFRAWVLLVGASLLASTATAGVREERSAGRSPAERARMILAETGVSGGLVVHVGCGDADGVGLTAALRADEAFVVVGLESDAARAAALRTSLREGGLYGPVTVMQWDGASLPFADNLVSLLVISDPGGVSREEMERVLCPGGSVFHTHDPSFALHRFRKPWPAEIDEWTHYLYNGSGNACSLDTLVGPPKALHWWAGPYSSRSHNWTPSTASMVSSAGRLSYIRDEGPTAAMPQKRADMNWAHFKGDVTPLPENCYIQSAKLNGKPMERCFIYHRELALGGELELTLGHEPNTAWGVSMLPGSADK